MRKLITIFICLLPFFSKAQTTYYVSWSDIAANDANNGTSTSTPWKTLRKAETTLLNPGDKILFKRGDTWNFDNEVSYFDGFDANGSGTSGNYVEYGAYGTGARPIFTDKQSVPGWNTSGNWVNRGSNRWAIYISGLQTLSANYRCRLWINSVEQPLVDPLSTFPTAVTSTRTWAMSTDSLYVYSTSNPATAFSSMEKSNGTKKQGFKINNLNYVKVSNIDMRATATNNFVVAGCTNIIIDSCNAGYDGTFSPIAISESSIGVLSNCVINSNYKIDNQFTFNYGPEDGFSIDEGTDGWDIYNDSIINMTHSGFGFDYSTSSIITNNSVHDCYITAPDVAYGRGFTFNTNTGSYGNKIYNNKIINTPTCNQISGPGLDMYNNVIDSVTKPAYRAPTDRAGAALAIISYNNTEIRNINIFNNTILNCQNMAFDIEGRLDDSIVDLKIINNVLYNNATGGQETNPYQIYFLDDNPIVKRVTVRNNILYKPGESILVYYSPNDVNSAWDKTVAQFNATDGAYENTINGNINADPLLNSDYSLQAGSPAIEAGIDVGLPFTGSAPDIGAVAYTSIAAPTANAGSDVTIYLTQTSTASLDGSGSSGTSYQWREISTDYSSGAVISSPTSKNTTVTGFTKQGTFYFEIAATTGATTNRDSVVVRVFSNPPPANSTTLVDFDMAGTAGAINNRTDTLNYYAGGTPTYQRAFDSEGNRYDLARGRTNGLMIDSLRGKLYSILEDGYSDYVDGYTRSEIEVTFLNLDTTKTYMIEWQGYYPDEINYLDGGPMLNMFQIHGIATANPFGISLYPGGDLSIADLGTEDYLSPTRFSNFSTFVNKAHTLRLTINEGLGYAGQPNFLKIDMDGVQKYYRDTGNIGGEGFGDYLKFASLYDYGNFMVNGDSLARGRKFKLVTTSYKVWQLNDAVPPCLISASDKILFSPTTSTTLTGSVTNTSATYLWSQISGSAATIASPTSASTSITGLSEGDYVFRLKATNSLGVESLKDVNVTVKPDPTLAATGYNYDVIVDGVLNGTVSSLRNHDLDGSGFSFYEQGFSTGSTPYTGGLPTDRTIISTTGTVYKLQAYNANNALWLNSSQSGTLTLSTPAKLYGLKVALTSGGSTINYTVHYSDASTSTGSFSVPDWNCAGCANYVISALGRTDNSGYESSIWAIYENDITVDANKTVSSISFTSSGSWTGIFALSQVFRPTVFHVATTGNDATGNGTIDNPWASLSYACSQVTIPGDTIFVNSGNYTEPNRCDVAVGVNIKGATEKPHIKFHYVTSWPNDYPNESAISFVSATQGTNGNQTIENLIIDGDNLTATSAIAVIRRGGVKIKNCTIKDFYISGILYIGGSNVYSKPTALSENNEIANCVIDNCTDTAETYVGGALINIQGQKNFSVYDCILSDTSRGPGANGDIMISNDWNEGVKYYNNTSYKPSTGNDGWNFHLETIGLSGAEIYNNNFHGGDQVIDAGSRETSVFNYNYSYSYSIHHNNFYDNNGINGNGSHGKTAISVEGNETKNVLVYENFFDGIVQPLGITDGSAGVCNDSNIVFRNNVSVNTGTASSDAYQSLIELNKQHDGSIMQDIYIINNTIIPHPLPKTTAISINNAEIADNVVIANNIFLNGKNGYWLFVTNTGTFDGLTIRNNILYNNPNGNAANFSGNTVTNYINSGNINSDPLLNPDGSLQAGSPAIGAAYPYGYGNDIGAIQTAIAAPTVSTSGDQTIATNSTTVFSTPVPASGETITGYLWTDVTGSGSATITSPTSQNTGITGLSVGTHTFRITVTQSDGQTAYAEVNVTLSAAPTANAGSNQTITLPTSQVTLSGSGTVASGQTATYLWTKISGAGTQTITDNTTLTPTISGMTAAGDYVFQLKVTQTDTQFATSTVTITVNDNIPPVPQAYDLWIRYNKTILINKQ